MPTSTANEPYAAIQSRLAAQTTLVAALTGGYARSKSPQNQHFPQLVWQTLAQGLGPTDAERVQYRDERITIDVFGYDRDQLTDLADLVDTAFNDSILAGAMNTTHWKITLMQRDTAWQELDYPSRQDGSGNPLWQITSDWRFKAQRKQNVA